MLAAGTISVAEIVKRLGVNRDTFYGKPSAVLPVLPIPQVKRPGRAPRSRARGMPGQLHLFAQAGT